MAIRLSRRQAKEADRVGGIELLLLWPASLGAEPALTLDHERDATATEKREAERLISESCQAYGLVPVHVRVMRFVRPVEVTLAKGEDRVHLSILIIGQRWVYASTHRQPKTMYADQPET